MKHFESFGAAKHYRTVILMVENNKHHWRKVANLLNNVRRILRPWGFVDKENQIKSTINYVNRAIIDTKLPECVIKALCEGMKKEFQINF